MEKTMNKNRLRFLILCIIAGMLAISCDNPIDVEPVDNFDFSDIKGEILSETNPFKTVLSSNQKLSLEQATRALEYENIALNKNAYSRSIYGDSFLPINTVDGETNSVWGSTSTRSTWEWIYIDLGSITEMSGLGIKWYKNFYALKYDIFLSNDANSWIKVAAITKNSAGDDIFQNNTQTFECRYVALSLLQRNIGKAVFGITEFEVYQQIQVVNFPDPIFESTVRNLISKPQGNILSTDLIGITKLEFIATASENNIKNLYGIDNFPNLKELKIVKSSIKNLNLSNNKELEILILESLALIELDITGCTNLIKLDCFATAINNLDVTKNINLKILLSQNSNLNSLDIRNNLKLITFGCSDNNISSLDISNNTLLEAVYASRNNLTALDFSKNVKLKKISITYNQFASLDLTNNPELTDLYCEFNNIYSLDLSNKTKLTEIHCQYNNFTSNSVNIILRDLFFYAPSKGVLQIHTASKNAKPTGNGIDYRNILVDNKGWYIKTD